MCFDLIVAVIMICFMRFHYDIFINLLWMLFVYCAVWMYLILLVFIVVY